MATTPVELCTHCGSDTIYKNFCIDGEDKLLLCCKMCIKPIDKCYCCYECNEIKCTCCPHCHLTPSECNCCMNCGHYKHRCICDLCDTCGLENFKCKCNGEDIEEREEREKEEYRYWLESYCGPASCEDCCNPECTGNC